MTTKEVHAENLGTARRHLLAGLAAIDAQRQLMGLCNPAEDQLFAISEAIGRLLELHRTGKLTTNAVGETLERWQVIFAANPRSYFTTEALLSVCQRKSE